MNRSVTGIVLQLNIGILIFQQSKIKKNGLPQFALLLFGMVYAFYPTKFSLESCVQKGIILHSVFIYTGNHNSL